MEYATSWCLCSDAVNDNGNIVYTQFHGCRGYIGPGVNPTNEEVLAFERNNNTDTSVMCAVFVSPIKINAPGHIIYENVYCGKDIKPEFEQQKAELDQRNKIRLSKHKQETELLLAILNKTAEDIAPFIEITGERILARIDNGVYFKDGCPKDWECIPNEWYSKEYYVKTLLPWNSPEAELIRSKARQTRFLNLF
jgi:hypothetical protein